MDRDPRIGATRLRAAASIRESEGTGVAGQLFLADRTDDRPGLLLGFTDDSGRVRFAGGWEEIADHRYLNRWRSARIVEISLRAGGSVTFAGPRRPLTAVVDGYARAVPVRH